MEAWQEAFAQLKGQYTARSTQRLEQIGALLAALAKQPDDIETLRQIMRHFHWLAGSGGIYDLPVVSDVGGHGEGLCSQLLASHRPLSEAEIKSLRLLIETAQRSLEGESAHDGRPERSGRATTSLELDVLLFDQDPVNLKKVTGLLEEQGLLVRDYGSYAGTKQAMREREPKGILLSAPGFDLEAQSQAGTGKPFDIYELIETERSSQNGDQTVIFLVASQAGRLDRVRATYAGADAVIEPPFDWEKIVAAMRQLIDMRRGLPYRVLSVEDDPDQAAYIRAVLESIGCRVETCSDASHFAEMLTAFDPELLLLDVLLGELTGFDLAQYVRQDRSHASLPIIFLTTQTYIESKINALKLGAEDFLAKPVARERLAAAVAAKVEKARVGKEAHVLDGLTQLSTFSAFVSLVERSLVKHKANQNRRAAMIILDIDGFTEMNRRLGYAVGDQVLSELGSLVKRRLRRAIAGRHGADSVVIYLEDMSESEALLLSGRLVEKFSNLMFKTRESMIFDATVCAGIAAIPDVAPPSVGLLLESAEKALAQAKAAGKGSLMGWSNVARAMRKSP